MSQCLNPDCLQGNPSNHRFCKSCGSTLLLAQRYRAIAVLGQGGFGRTFLAVDEFKPSHPKCVIKQLLPQAQGTDSVEKASELFDQEAVLLERLGNHSQIPDLMAYFTEDNRQYLIQEYIAGQTLEKELGEQGVFSEAKIWDFLKDILPVLQFVHENNVIHRDIKPENIIRRQDGKIVLVDFGASKSTKHRNISVTGTVIGTAEYTAPEQAMGKPQFCSDLYSLGVTCLYLLTNISPLELYSIEEGDWAWRDFLQDNPVGEKLGSVLDKLIERALKKRYQTVEELLNEILPDKSNGLTLNQNKSSILATIQPKLNNSIHRNTFVFETVTVTVESSGLFGRKQRIKLHEMQCQAEQIILNLTENVTLEMVRIPEGKFLMGSPETEYEADQEEFPQHWVTVPSFYMGKYPVTQQQWQAIMGYNPSHFNGLNKPVESVSWHECVKFCDKLSQKFGWNFTLPSEAQWEYACRAGTTTPFYFGETITSELANYDATDTYANEPQGKYRQQTTDVGSFPPNTFGLYDMHGNVWEWCMDDWHENYLGAPTDGSAWVTNASSLLRVMRGGSWDEGPEFCRSAFRVDFNPDYEYTHGDGVRVVCGVPRSS